MGEEGAGREGLDHEYISRNLQFQSPSLDFFFASTLKKVLSEASSPTQNCSPAVFPGTNKKTPYGVFLLVRRVGLEPTMPEGGRFTVS